MVLSPNDLEWMLPPPPTAPLIKPATALVTSISPFKVRVETDPVGVESYPETLVDTSRLAIGDKVWVVHYHESLLVVGRFTGLPATVDTGWVAIGLESGFTGSCVYRRIGNQVFVRFDISGTISGSTQLTNVFPTAVWPTTTGVTIYAAGSYFDPATARTQAVSWFAADTGTVRATSPSVAATRVRGHVSWVLG